MADDDQPAAPSPFPASSSWLVTNLRPITVLGVPAVVMAFLVWWITQSLTHQLTNIEDTLLDHDRTLATAVSRLDAFLYSMCLSVATTDVDRARCAIARSPDARPELHGDRKE